MNIRQNTRAISPQGARAAMCLAGVLTSMIGFTVADAHTTNDRDAPWAGSHDIGLPAWGPYSKAYLGLSHIPDVASGMRFDISVFAGPHATSTPSVPNASLNTGFAAWEAAPDLSYYAYRQMIDGRQVYAEIAYFGSSPGAETRFVRVDLVNDGPRARTLSVNLLASMQLPGRGAKGAIQPRRILRARLPAHGVWVSGMHYTAHRRARPSPQDRLVYDGWLRGEIRADGLVDGRALRLAFGDEATYAIPRSGAVAVLRYRAKAPVAMRGTVASPLPAAEDGGVRILSLPAGTRTLRIVPDGTIDVEGIAFVPASDASLVSFAAEDTGTRPVSQAGPVPESMVLKYRQANAWYGLRWHDAAARTREFRNGSMDVFFPGHSTSKTLTVAHGDDLGHYTNLQFGATLVPAGGRRTMWAVVSAGSRDAVQQALASPFDSTAMEQAWRSAKARAATAKTLPAGDRFRLARQLIGANLLMNVVYPVYTQDQFVRHFTPGKWWDSLYTWDSGFIGLGLSAVAPRLAADVLRAYTTAPGAQSAFIHHGTPMPVQHHQMMALWNATGDRRMLAEMYPRLRQFYEFLLGRFEGSTTARLPSGLLQSWDYFYNSGGWDDLPPQVQVHAAKEEGRVAPMVTTSHAIRAAKILRMAARELGRRADEAQYDADIARLTSAIQGAAWDPASGYFGYVVHDRQGRPTGLLRNEGGENWNRTLDGVQPLIAGVTTPQQTRAIIANLRDPTKLLSPIGITAVDQSASYYRSDGYWNGTVWFPHQWFVWKAMLDQGEGAFAWQIARTALEIYESEAEASWTSAEHFEIATGQGTGWHQFSGLSSPIANWFDAYFVPGRLTAGFDVWVRSTAVSADRRRLSASLTIDSARTDGFVSLIATLAPGGSCRAQWNGRPVVTTAIHDGAYEVRIPLPQRRTGQLVVAC